VHGPEHIFRAPRKKTLEGEVIYDLRQCVVVSRPQLADTEKTWATNHPVCSNKLLLHWSDYHCSSTGS
jgi:hypothetical protein